MDLSDRKKRILSAIVEEYIMTGEPVGSKYLAALPDIGLSSATIRNEMSELSELGYIDQPHTSAGRVPTQLGYRLYVDSLMGSYKLTDDERKAFDSMKNAVSGDIETTLEKAGALLANVTGYAAVSTVPDDKAASIRRIQVMPAGARSILLVMLTSSGIVKTCIYRIDEDVTVEMLEFFSNLVNDCFCGKQLGIVTDEYITKIKSELYEYTYALSPVLDIIFNELKSISGEILVGGTENLLNHSEFDSAKIIEIMKFLQQRHELLRTFNTVKNGVQVKIGNESGVPFMQNSAIIAAPYAFKGKICGSVGIIGPARIDYPKMVSNIKYFASSLSNLINESFGD